jgi:hypothetical protein
MALAKEPLKFNPIVLKDYVLRIRDVDYARQSSSVTFTPSASAVTWTGGKPGATFTDTSTATWVCGIEFAQDWDNADSLSAFLFDNEGKTEAVTFIPRSGSGAVWEASLIITPGAIGGAVNATAASTVSLGVQGKPKRRAYAAATDAITAP